MFGGSTNVLIDGVNFFGNPVLMDVVDDTGGATVQNSTNNPFNCPAPGASDTTPPTITLIGSDPATVEIGSVYSDAGATASDNVDGDITADIVTVNPVDANTLGSYIVTYNVSDSSDNDADEVSRTVNVVDATPPTITASRVPAAANANGWNNVDVTVSYVAEDAGSGIDASASGLADDVIGEGENQTAEGTAVDNAGNSASASITGINVDKTDPVVTVSDQLARATSESGASVTFSGVSASDALSGIDTFVCSSPDGGTFAVGVTAVDCTATDLAGNSSSDGFNVIVTDDCDCTKGVGFWKKQFKTSLKGKGKQQIDDSALNAYLSIVGLGSGVFGDMTIAEANDVFNPPKPNRRGGGGSHSGSGSRSSEASGSSSTGRLRNRGGSKGSSHGGTKLAKQE